MRMKIGTIKVVNIRVKRIVFRGIRHVLISSDSITHEMYNKILLRFYSQGYISTSQSIHLHRAPFPARTHHQIPTVIHPTHHQVPASYRTSRAASTVLTVNTSARRAQMRVRSRAYRNSRDRKVDRVSASRKTSRQ